MCVFAFSLAVFNILSLFYTLSGLIMICCRVFFFFFFWPCLLGAACICLIVFFLSLGKFTFNLVEDLVYATDLQFSSLMSIYNLNVLCFHGVSHFLYDSFLCFVFNFSYRLLISYRSTTSSSSPVILL